MRSYGRRLIAIMPQCYILTYILRYRRLPLNFRNQQDFSFDEHSFDSLNRNTFDPICHLGLHILNEHFFGHWIENALSITTLYFVDYGNELIHIHGERPGTANWTAD